MKLFPSLVPCIRAPLWITRAIFLLILSLIAGEVFAAQQQSFESPQAGVTALINAVKSNDENALNAIFGADGSKLLSSGDAVADAHYRAQFSKAFDEANKIVFQSKTQATLVVGADEWPMPIPLIKSAEGWHFDTDKGEKEILKRRIGRNELSAMKVCAAIVEAEREYAASHLDGDGIPVYASRFISSPNKRDGLYWPTAPEETKSPLGEFLAAAADEGYSGPDILRHEPYYGYYYRILTSQGENAHNGARDYFVKGKLIGGFAILAYPARYGASGIASFLVDHNGTIYERDLGPKTKSVTATLNAFNPTTGWKKVEQTL